MNILEWEEQKEWGKRNLWNSVQVFSKMMKAIQRKAQKSQKLLIKINKKWRGEAIDAFYSKH